MRIGIFLCAIILLAVAMFNSSQAYAHSGGLNAQGCHNDRRTGGYHCHRKGNSGVSTYRTINNYPSVSPRYQPRRTNEPYYYNCAHARRAGVAPIRRGQPGYRRGLDADNDGIACEPYPRRRSW